MISCKVLTLTSIVTVSLIVNFGQILAAIKPPIQNKLVRRTTSPNPVAIFSNPKPPPASQMVGPSPFVRQVRNPVRRQSPFFQRIPFLNFFGFQPQLYDSEPFTEMTFDDAFQLGYEAGKEIGYEDTIRVVQSPKNPICGLDSLGCQNSIYSILFPALLSSLNGNNQDDYDYYPSSDGVYYDPTLAYDGSPIDLDYPTLYIDDLSPFMPYTDDIMDYDDTSSTNDRTSASVVSTSSSKDHDDKSSDLSSSNPSDSSISSTSSTSE